MHYFPWGKKRQGEFANSFPYFHWRPEHLVYFTYSLKKEEQGRSAVSPQARPEWKRAMLYFVSSPAVARGVGWGGGELIVLDPSGIAKLALKRDAPFLLIPFLSPWMVQPHPGQCAAGGVYWVLLCLY